MMTRNRLAALLLVLCTLMTAVSCADNHVASDETTAAITETDSLPTETEEERLYPDLPDDITFDGEDFKFLHWEVLIWDSNNSKDLYAESENGDNIQDAVFRRNSAVEEKYGVTFSVEYKGHDVIISDYTKIIRSNESPYDVIFPRLTDSTSLVAQGYYYNLKELPYINFENPWWDQKAVQDLTIDHKLFMVASDITIIDKDATAAMIFNKQMALDHNLPDIYELVNTGKWTLDAMLDTTKGVAGDIDGNSVIDQNDRFGIIGQDDFAMSAFTGAGARFATKDSDDLPVYTFYNEKNVAICEKILEIMCDENNFYNNHKYSNGVTIDANDLFANNQGLYKWIRLEDVTRLRQTDTDFGIVPTPKYEEEQEEYYSTVSVHTCGLITVPAIYDHPEKVGLILEALAAESKYTLQPAYYDVALKTKGARDDESAAMLDIIINQRVYDFGDIFGFGSFANTWLSLSRTGNRDIASLYNKNEKIINRDIDKLVKKVTELD